MIKLKKYINKKIKEKIVINNILRITVKSSYFLVFFNFKLMFG
jgi:hypothetical protein